MSDDFASNYAGIDSALDRAFAAVGEPVRDRDGAAVLPPNPQQVDWEQQAQKEADAEKKAKAAGKDKAGAKGGDKNEEGEDKPRGNKHDVKARNKAEQRDGIDRALDKATAKSAEAQQKRADDRSAQTKGEKPAPLNARSFNAKEVATSRRELRERFPGQKLSARMAQFEQWEESFKRDPAGTREAIMQAYLKVSPQNFSKAKGEEKGKASLLGDVLESAFEGTDDLEDLKDYADKYGDKLPHLLKQLNQIERDLIEDPVGTSARLAANYGALEAPKPQEQQRAEQLPPPASPEEDRHRVSQGIEKAIEHNILPGLKNDEIADQVAFVLERMTRTQDRFADLRKAYAIVVGEAAPTAAEPVNDKGSRSITGGPSAASTGRGGRRAKPGSLDAALDNAFAGRS